ncbi:Aldehyde/histidinol dehydrogenase [Penicillium occitanis (nom. inval.)]|nr:Aldehyde/histidinol dehydrogenase [Penicillium occitanis (nom. inval.)]PCG94591.1 hypothetical protein PENOC_082020 [Penicillium occitanis (nom. inval.)]
MGSTALSDIETRLFINNEFVPAKSGKTFQLINPATEEPSYAKGAWEEWFAKDGMKISLEKATKNDTNDVHKTLQLATDPQLSLSLTSLVLLAMSMSKDHLNFTLKQPYGDVAAIIPWNVPILMALNKIAPAVAVDEILRKAPLTSILLAQLIKETGLFPPGVVQILSGARESGEALASHMEIRKIAFTGMHIEAWRVAFNSGQTCTSAARLYVQESVLEPFLAVFRPTFEGFLTNHGDPLDRKVTHGPQADKLQYESVLKFIEAGKNSTAQMLTGGKRKGDKGYFIEPTIFLNPPDDNDVVTKETFGPVITFFTFKTEEEAITRANATEYALFSSVFIRDIFRALRIAKKYESGTVTINCTSHYQAVDMAFGGVKGSGDGREYGRWGLDSWLEIKSVLIDLTE